MNKKDLIDEVSMVTGNKKKAETFINAFLTAISNALTRGESVKLIGFGTFKVVKTKPRIGRHPRTGDEIKIDSKMVAKFIPSKTLLQEIIDLDDLADELDEAAFPEEIAEVWVEDEMPASAGPHGPGGLPPDENEC